MNTSYDIAIIGSGFGGSLLALIARRLGLSVLLLEKGRHPRFAVGESTSPLANLLLEQLAQRYDLPRLLPLTAYGSWQQAYPEVGCGLKRGFTFFHHAPAQAFGRAADRRDQLLVAASPNDRVADTHWLRADVDQFLMGEAVAAGADYCDQATLAAPEWRADGEARLTGARPGQAFSVRARLIVDATGPRGFLSRSLHLPEAVFENYPVTQSLYSHFSGVRRCEDLDDFETAGTPPYPPDSAAVHHVFDGGWMWALRFDNGITSAGIALTDALAGELRLSEGEAAWRRFLGRFPSVAKQFGGATPTRPFTHVPRLAYRTAQAAGPSWTMLPSAAAFVDPLFSTGIPLTLLGVERLGRIMEEAWDSADFDLRLQGYADITLQEADVTANFIGGCYAAMPCFSVFASLAMFYFAAASFNEMARRLDKPQLATRFLASGHAEFGLALRRAAAWAHQCAGRATPAEAADFTAQTARAVACLNIAGLCDLNKRNWYGVEMEDVVAGAAKLGMTASQIRAVLQAAPWAQA